jgi:hypothetical protein
VLMQAVKAGYSKIVKALLERKYMNLNKGDGLGWKVAARHDEKDVAKALFKNPSH